MGSTTFNPVTKLITVDTTDVFNLGPYINYNSASAFGMEDISRAF